MSPRMQHLKRLEALSIAPRAILQSQRFVPLSTKRDASAAPLNPATPAGTELLQGTPKVTTAQPATLSRIPTSAVLRSYLIMRMSSSPALLSLSFSILRRMLDSKSLLLNIERNPVIRNVLKSTFYAQFCAGETKSEVKANTDVAREVLGYDGIMIEYALEVLKGDGVQEITEEETVREIEVWRKGMLDSIEVAQEGDFIGLKWSGLGRRALQLLKAQQPPTPAMHAAIIEACDAAAVKNVALLPGAEEEATNPGLEKWTLELQKRYNTLERGRAIMYTTYQCYLKSIPDRLAAHLAKAREEGYIAGVKLVRGAYLASEPRHLIWETKEGTDACYDNCTEAVLKRQWTPFVKAPASISASSFPEVDIFLATHNHASVRKAQAIRNVQGVAGEKLPRLAYAQLQGMADEISQELVQEGKTKGDKEARAIKCMTWGTTTECLNFLLRRASENREAAMRTEDTRKAMGKELWRRIKRVFGSS